MGRATAGLVVLLVGLAALLLAPGASALLLEAGHHGDAFVVTVSTDEPTGPLDLVVSHREASGRVVVDAIVPVELAAGERRVVPLEGLPALSYDVELAPRGAHRATAAPPVHPGDGAAPNLTALAQDGAVAYTLTRLFTSDAPPGARAVLDVDGPTHFLVRAGSRGEVEVARSEDGGASWEAPVALTGPAPSERPDWTYLETTRFWDGTLGVLHKQAQPMMPGGTPWSLTRLYPDGARVMSTATLQLPAGRTAPTDAHLELLAMPDGRVLLLAETFARDPTAQDLDGPSMLQAWRLLTDGSLQDEVRIPLQHGTAPGFEALLAEDGTIRLAWTHGETSDAFAPRLWTTSSDDGGASFAAPRWIDLPLAGGADAWLTGAAVDAAGTLFVTLDSERADGAIHWDPYLVRIPRDREPTQLALRDIASLPDRAGYDHVRALARGARVWLHYEDGEGTRVFESTDGGSSFTRLTLRSASGERLRIADMRVGSAGLPVFATTAPDCGGCYASVGPSSADPVVGLVPWESAPWGPDPIDLEAQPILPTAAFPWGPRRPLVAEPQELTPDDARLNEPGFEAAGAVLAVGVALAVTLRRKRRS